MGPALKRGTLAIYPPTFDSLEQLGEVLVRYNVTSLWLTAGLFNTVVDRNVYCLKNLRQLLIGGDVLSVAHVRKASGSLPNTTIINGYGPTENTTFTCCYRIPRSIPENRSIPIGKPISNTQVYILDENLQQVPIGVPGDIWAAGDGLSKGYLKRADLTAEAFHTHPLNGARLYKTGDRGRFLDDGNIEFLGRRDGQVKIRGFRLELGEIENAFRNAPGVQDAAISVREDGNGGKSLLAYVVAKPEVTLDSGRLHAHIAEVLPAHACPSRIIFLSELPLGPNGKVDKRKLPLPSETDGNQTQDTPPSTPIEQRIASIWCDLLKVAKLSINDNFFHLGGESLLATRAISQVNREFSCNLTIARIFEAPTVRSFAKIIEANSDTLELTSERLQPAPSAAPIPDVSNLSESEVDLLLKQLMENK